MEENKNKETGSILIDWDFPEFTKHDRGKKWYLIAGIVFLVILIYAVLTKNILFAIILVIAAFIFILQQYQEPQAVDAAVTDEGILIGSKFYDYEELKIFWVIYKPPLAKLLYLDFKNPLKKSLPIPLDNVDPVKLREILTQYLEEDLEREEEELGDRMAKVLKM